jgi:hypothetical protein
VSEYPFGVGVVDTMIGFPSEGLSLERIVGELRGVSFKDEVWPKFLRHNAAKVLDLARRSPE